MESQTKRPKSFIVQPTLSHYHRRPATPNMEAQYWSFMLSGLVREPLLLSYADLLALPAVTRQHTLISANQSAVPTLMTADWRGADVRTLLDLVQPLPAARYAHLFAADGYTTSVPLETFQNGLIAHTMNDLPLPATEGFPARLVIPAVYTYKQPKWIQRIVLADHPLNGFWEQRGWPLDGTVLPAAWITQPHPYAEEKNIAPLRLEGQAYAGGTAISDIMLSIDHGPWVSVEFDHQTPSIPASWHADWTPYAAGIHHIKVQATTDQHRLEPTSQPHSIVVYT